MPPRVELRVEPKRGNYEPVNECLAPEEVHEPQGEATDGGPNSRCVHILGLAIPVPLHHQVKPVCSQQGACNQVELAHQLLD